MMRSEHIEWSQDYELDIEDIDFQHHYFLNLINRLSDELEESDDLKHRAALISELNAYARFHFISEENIMYRAGYPQLDEHKKHHIELIEQLSLKENMLAVKQTKDEAREVIEFLTKWFLQHTVIEDKLFSDFFHNKQQ